MDSGQMTEEECPVGWHIHGSRWHYRTEQGQCVLYPRCDRNGIGSQYHQGCTHG